MCVFVVVWEWERVSSDSIQWRRRRIRRSSSQTEERRSSLSLSLPNTYTVWKSVGQYNNNNYIHTQWRRDDHTQIKASSGRRRLCTLSFSLSLAPKNNYLALLLIEWRWWIWWSGSGVEWTDAFSQCQQSTYIRLYRYISFYYKIAIDIARKLEKVRCFSIGCD